MSNDADIVRLVQYFLKKLSDERDVVIQELANGRVSNMEEYQKRMGILHGLNLANDMIRMYRKAIDDD